MKLSSARVYGTVVSDSRFVPTKPKLTPEEWKYLTKEQGAMTAQYDSTAKALSASKPHQSSPQSLLEWLEGRPVTDAEAKVGVVPYPNLKVFSREFIGDELRAFIMKDGKRIEVYAFRIIGGEFGSSGAETVVNLLSAEEGYEYDRSIMTKHEPIVPKEYDDEWEGHYAPSTSIDNYRVTTHWYPDEEAV